MFGRARPRPVERTRPAGRTPILSCSLRPSSGRTGIRILLVGLDPHGAGCLFSIAGVLHVHFHRAFCVTDNVLEGTHLIFYVL